MKSLFLIRFTTAIALAFILCLDTFGQAPKTLKLSKILNGKRACVIGNGSVQFLSQDELVLLTGPEPDCYKNVNNLELVTLSTDGRILASKPWPSTFPFVALDSRVAIGGSGEVLVLNDRLKTIQTLSLPTGDQSTVSLSKEGTSTLFVTAPRGETLAYAGSPLTPTRDQKSAAGDQRILSHEDGEMIALKDNKLLTIQSDGKSKTFADITWLHDCNRLCQSWSGGTSYAVSANGERSAFVSSATRFPITDESGMFPFWRVLVIDLSSGKEIYRREFDTKTSRRSAQLSPDGKLLLLSDGDELQFQSLP